MVQWPWPPGTIVVRVGYPEHAIPEGEYCTVASSGESPNNHYKMIQLIEYANIEIDGQKSIGWWIQAFRLAESDHNETTIKEHSYA